MPAPLQFSFNDYHGIKVTGDFYILFSPNWKFYMMNMYYMYMHEWVGE